MDHKAFLRSLDVEERRRLSTPSDRAGLAHLALHWGAIALVGTAIAARVPGWPLLMAVQGVLVIFLFTLLHETTHLTPFRTRWLNRAVGAVCALLVVLPPAWFRLLHMAHHRHTQDPEHDPELATPKPETWRQYALHVSGLPVWRSQIAALVRNARGRRQDAFVPATRRAEVRAEARIMLALYALAAAASLAAGSWMIVTVWLGPILLGQPVLRLYLLAEHGRCPTVANMFENSRTTHTARLVRFLAWNMPYHAEHHACPTVPFHRLPELHRLTRPHLAEVEDGYLRFNRRYAAALR